MAVVITPTPDVGGLFVDVALAGLTAAAVYDVYRVQVRYNGEDDLGVPVYEAEVPGRRALWSAVAHRVGWTSATAAAGFRDYEARLRPFRYYVVPTELSPQTWDFADGEYDITQGVLSPVVHMNRLMTEQTPGLLVIRSTTVGLFAADCVFDLDEIRYTARGQELAVIGRQYPVPIMDTREARRGSLTLLTKTLGAYYDLRRIVFPPSGRIKPVVVHSGADPTMLLDDMTLVPFDVTVEQASQRNPDLRWVRLDYVEVDPMDPFVERPGDADSTPLPVANFTVTPSTRRVGEKITMTDSSTAGSAPLSVWDWTFSPSASITTGKRTSQGPHKISYGSTGTKKVKLRVGDATGAFGVVEKSFTVVK